MNPASDAPHWQVGDRFWAPWYGTGTIVSLRRSPATPIPHAQARLVPDPGISIWVWLEGAVRLAPDEPDRPSEGLQSVTVGQQVWHRDWGHGTVFEAKPLGDGRQAARIAFDRNEGMLRWLVLGSGALREATPSLHAVPPAHPAPPRAPKSHKRVRLLDDTFEPAPLRLPALAEDERAAWVRTVAARRAAHLRAVAGRLLVRGDEAAPMRCELLAPLFRGEGLTPVTLPPALAGLDDLRAAMTARPGALRRRRLAPHATRWLRALGDGTVWVSASAQCDFAADFYRLRSWAASCADGRFRLGARGAAALLDYAAQTERAHGLDPQAPLWLAKPTGWLHGEALMLAQRIFAGANHDLIEHVWKQHGPVGIDLRLPLDAQLPDAAVAAAEAAQRIVAAAFSIAARRGVQWSEARLLMTDKSAGCHPDDTWCRITLETRAPFHRVDAWINDAFDLAGYCWLPIRFWPDAGEPVRGPCEPDWFYPDGTYRHWMRRTRHKLRIPPHSAAP